MSRDFVLRPATEADFPAILALNADSVHFLSPVDAARLDALHRWAALHLVAAGDAGIVGFLLAMLPDAAYDSPNFRWFVREFPSFLYIDRVVIGESARGTGLAQRFYAAASDFARGRGVTKLVCEYDLVPPNPVSERFHLRQGFVECGRQWLAGGAKQVSLQQRQLSALPER